MTIVAADGEPRRDALALERLATEAYLEGRESDFRTAIERAHEAHLQRGNPFGASRAAFWLGLHLLLRGQAAQANGWLARGRRLVQGRDCVEHGYLQLPIAELHLVHGKAKIAESVAREAAAIGERFVEADLVTCARHVEGRALLAQGRIAAGLSLLDEAMLVVIAGKLSPIVTGLVYCSVIQACREVYALGRAREWTSALARWCGERPEMAAFTGTCRVHRSEILQLDGAWEEAMAEACRACEARAKSELRPPAAAFYQRGEIHRLRGEFGAAEDAYREASRAGLDPQPGLALLRLAQGRVESACAAMRRLQRASRGFERQRLLPACVEIFLAAGETDDAQLACAELEQRAQELRSEMLTPAAAQARGAVELAAGNAAAALPVLRCAFEGWRAIEAPYEAGRVRVLLACACRSLGDEEGAALELAAARAAFQQLAAWPDCAQVASLQRECSRPAGQRLTPRERQVLRLLATGRTNRTIAAELRLSERTVDRHVSNIFTKLDVPSRAAATAHAYTHKLL